jgi:hypothetical protein
VAEVVGIRPFQSSLDEAGRNRAEVIVVGRAWATAMAANAAANRNEGPAVKDSVNLHEERL